MSLYASSDKSQYALQLFTEASALRNLKLICPVCTCALQNAVETTVCHHLFCADCVLVGKPCPTCPNGPVLGAQDIVPSPAVRTAIEEQEVHCVHPQCNRWRGKHLMLADHLRADCDYTILSCTQCSQMLTRQEMKTHVEQTCLSRLVPCVYCNKVEKASDLQRHDSKCELKPVTCPNKCDPKLILARKQMSVHLEQTCPKHCSPCPLRSFGCQIRPPRAQMDDHLSDPLSLPRHLRAFEQVHERNQQLEQSIAELVLRMKKMEDESKEVVAQLCVLHEQQLQLQQSVTPVVQFHTCTPTSAVSSSSSCSTIAFPDTLQQQQQQTVTKTPSQQQQHTGRFFWYPECTESLANGDVLDVCDSHKRWTLSEVTQQPSKGGQWFGVHYLGWNGNWDEHIEIAMSSDCSIIRSPRIAPALSKSMIEDAVSLLQQVLKEDKEEHKKLSKVLSEARQCNRGWSCCGELKRHVAVCSRSTQKKTKTG